MGEHGELLGFDQFIGKLGNCNYMSFYSIIHPIPNSWKTLLATQGSLDYKNLYEEFNQNKVVNLIYRIRKKDELLLNFHVDFVTSTGKALNIYLQNLSDVKISTLSPKTHIIPDKTPTIFSSKLRYQKLKSIVISFTRYSHEQFMSAIHVVYYS